jgi:hypothetical protein
LASLLAVATWGQGGGDARPHGRASFLLILWKLWTNGATAHDDSDRGARLSTRSLRKLHLHNVGVT